jgi:hypothetical protein
MHEDTKNKALTVSVKKRDEEIERLIYNVTDINNDIHEVYFSSNHMLNDSPEVSATITLLPAMKSKVPHVLLNSKMDSLFEKNQHTVQDIYSLWYEDFSRVQFISDSICEDLVSIAKTEKHPKRVGMFFSGGVDSFYSFLKHQSEVTDLIFVHGYDIALSDKKLREQTSAQLKKVEKENNVNLIEVETNLRDYLDSYVDWGKLGHGPALMVIGHLLSYVISKIYIPSSYHYGNLFPWGTHPLLDPYWGSSKLQFVHDGCEAKRVDKVALIATNDLALQSLRVCWKNPNSAYNCCECEKCIRTMINLEVYDVLVKSTAFPAKLTIDKIKKMPINSHSAREFVTENIRAISLRKDKKPIEEALNYALNKKTPSPPIHHLIRRRLRSILGRD